MRKVIVGTRGSKLALTQTKGIVTQLNHHYPDIECDIKIIQTKGDLFQNTALEKIGDKGLFVKEIEEQLLTGEIDLAIHSMKDMPSTSPLGLMFTKAPKREDSRDVLVLKGAFKSLADLPIRATIGTGSKRRKFQLLKLRPDLNVVPIRGNVDTRLAKIESENLDGIVLAAAGLHRLGYHDKITEYLSTDEVIPAPAQGALALQIRENDTWLADKLQALEDQKAQLEIQIERGFLEGINGTCHEPIGAKATIVGEEFTLMGLYGDSVGNLILDQTSGPIAKGRQLGFELGVKLRKMVQKRSEER